MKKVKFLLIFSLLFSAISLTSFADGIDEKSSNTGSVPKRSSGISSDKDMFCYCPICESENLRIVVKKNTPPYVFEIRCCSCYSLWSVAGVPPYYEGILISLYGHDIW